MTPGLYLSIALCAAVFLLAWFGSGAMRRYALSRQLLDVPNARSSHEMATPRGAGVAIAVSVLAAMPFLAPAGVLTWPQVFAIVGAGGMVAGIGFADDRRHIAAWRRLLVHLAAAGLVWWAAGAPAATMLFGHAAGSTWLGAMLLILFLVWMVNLTNFMDGIDAIAGVETITVAAGGALLVVVAGFDPAASLFPAVLAAAAAGYLIWNWPPARVFMGDAGSGFLGLMLGTAAILAAAVSAPLFWSWIILSGVFITDATITLARRLLAGRRIHEAHSEHAYQHAARKWGRHLPVTLATGAINLLWLLPIAFFTATERLHPGTGVAIASVPLVAIAVWLGAGCSPKREGGRRLGGNA